MSLTGKISLLLSAISVLILGATLFILGGWINYLYIILTIIFLGLIGSAVSDRKLYFEFFTMRTTKGGLNMGTLIVLMMALLVCLNYLSVKYNDTVDLTEEKLNSLSDQSIKLISKLSENVTVKVFYRGAKAKDLKKDVEFQFSAYQQFTGQLSVQFYNTYSENLLAQQYLNDLSDKRNHSVFVFMEYKGKRQRVETPFKEKQITSALIQLTRNEKSQIYFLTGHGERDLKSQAESGKQSDDGIDLFKRALEDSSYLVNELNLSEEKAIPGNANVLAIVGPLSQILDEELKLLRQFARAGGRLFLAADPGQRHNLALLTKTLGVEYLNNYILNYESQLQGQSATSALGYIFENSDEITSKFRSNKNFTLFSLASEVRKAPDAPESLEVTDLVKTLKTSFALAELKQPTGDVDLRSHTVAIKSTGRLQKAIDSDAPEPSEDFAAVIFGDSDFVSNKEIYQGLNRDLALNAIAFLTKQPDLISMQPKLPKGTQLILTRYQMLGFLLAGILLPLLLIASSGVLWFRRRNA